MSKTLCFPECLFKKSEFAQLAVSACCANVFSTHRYKIPSHFLFQSSSTVLSTQTLIPTRQKRAVEILLKVYREFSQQCNKASGSTSNPQNGVDYLIIAPAVPDSLFLQTHSLSISLQSLQHQTRKSQA